MTAIDTAALIVEWREAIAFARTKGRIAYSIPITVMVAVSDALDAERARVRALVTALQKLRRHHEDCDDRYYACPALWEPGEMGFEDHRRGTCECGADAYNAIIDAALAAAGEGGEETE